MDPRTAAHVLTQIAAFLELRGVRDGAVCFLPRAEITGVQIIDDETIEFIDVGAVQ